MNYPHNAIDDMIEKKAYIDTINQLQQEKAILERNLRIATRLYKTLCKTVHITFGHDDDFESCASNTCQLLKNSLKNIT